MTKLSRSAEVALREAVVPLRRGAARWPRRRRGRRTARAGSRRGASRAGPGAASAGGGARRWRGSRARFCQRPGVRAPCRPQRDSSALTTPTSRSATAAAWSPSAASTMTRTTGSVPDLRSRTRPVSPSSPSASTHGVGDGGVGLRRGLVDVLDVDEHLREAGHDAGEVGERAARGGDPRGQHEPGEHAVTGGAVVEHDRRDRTARRRGRSRRAFIPSRT